MSATSVFSSLSRGYGTWAGSFDHKLEANVDNSLPSIEPDVQYHRHGVTVTPRASTAPVKMSIADDGHMGIPKTFLTRKGALMLFSTSKGMPQKPETLCRLQQKRCHSKDILNCSLKLKTLERLSLSVLQYDHKGFDKKAAIFSDKDNNFFLNFLNELDQENCFYDVHSQPGRDAQYYLQDLKNKDRISKSSQHRAKSAEIQGIRQHLQQAVPRFTGLHKETTQADVFTSGKDTLYSALSTLNINTDRTLSCNKVLSSKNLIASHKPFSFVDQQVSMDDDRLVWQQLNDEALESYSCDKGALHLPRAWCYQNSVKEERPRSPANSYRSEYQDGLLTEEACKLSEERDLDLLSDDMSDDSEEIEIDSPWTDGLQLEVSFRSRPLDTSTSEVSEIGNQNFGIVHPLDPPYSALIMEDFGVMPLANEKMSYTKIYQGIQDEESSSRRSTATPTVMSRIATERSVEQSQHDTKLMSNKDGDVTPSPADITATEVDASISCPRDDHVYALIKMGERGHDALMNTLGNATLTVPAEVTDCQALATSPTPKIDEKNMSQKSLVQYHSNKKESEETNQPQPLFKKSTHQHEIPSTGKEVIPSTGEEVEVSANVKENRKPELYSRVQKEKEEKDRKASKVKEEKQRTEANKMEEEERKRLQMEERRKAAEERLKKLTNEVAARKEEQNKKQEEEAASGKVNQTLVKPTPPSTKKVNTSHRKATWTGGKPVNKKGKLPFAANNKHFVNAMDLTSADDAGKEMALHEAKLNETKAVPVNMAKHVKVSAHQMKKLPQKKKVLVPEHLKEIISRKSDSQTQEELEAEIGKMMSAVDKALHEDTLHIEESEGLSADDFVLAQETLMERIRKAEQQIQEDAPRAESKKVFPQKAKLDKKAMKKQKVIDAKKKQALARKKETINEQQRLEKQRRLEEVRDLQDKIALNEIAQKTKEADAKRKAEEFAERIESIRLEEEQIARAEADARAQVAAVRQQHREEREACRKVELEHKKQVAIEKREKERTMKEAAKQAEYDMLDQIANVEMARILREEAQAKRDDEELAAEERFEAEMRADEKASDEAEERLRELERQAEEEAFQRIIEEKEAAERQRWALEKQAKIIRKEEKRAQQELLEREMKLKEEMKQHEEEEERQREQKRERLRELQRIEDEARERMQAVLEQRRAWALRRRECNLNARANLDAIKQSQGFTDPWIFTYFVHWPKESYMRLMGQDPKKKKGVIFLKTKPPVADASLHAVANLSVPSSADVAAVEG